MKNSKIGWTDHTFNPWIGCTKVSEECRYCYAEALELRWGKDLWGPGKERQRTSTAYWRQPLAWDKEAARDGVRPRVFCASLADVFDEAVPDEWRWDLFGLIGNCENLDWLLLTKRPALAAAFFAAAMANVWLGVSAGNQERAIERIPVLLSIPAVVHFVSVEPMLGPVSFSFSEQQPDWVICGGESGPHQRPMAMKWALDLSDDCARAGIPFFMKQLGGHPDKRERLEDFPGDLQIRQFPR